jgi:hypothetical protein
LDTLLSCVKCFLLRSRKRDIPMNIYHSEQYTDTRSHGWLSVSTEVINSYVHYSIYRTSFFVICSSIDLYEFCTRLGRCRAHSLSGDSFLINGLCELQFFTYFLLRAAFPQIICLFSHFKRIFKLTLYRLYIV